MKFKTSRWIINFLTLIYIISWNTRGLGSRKKRRVVKDFLGHENPDVVLLQEIKRESCDRRFMSSVWKARNKEWVVLPTFRASGGMTILWDALKFKCLEVVLGSFLATVKLESKEERFFWLTLVSSTFHFRKDF